MDLDIRTLFTVHALVSSTLGALMVVFWHTHRALPGLGPWTLGTILLGMAVWGGALRGMIPLLLSVLLANGLAFAGIAAFWNGIRRFQGRPARWGRALAAGATVIAALAALTYGGDDVLARIVIASAAMAVATALCALELLRPPPGERRSTTAVTAAVVFLVVTLSLAMRAILTAAVPPEPDLFAGSAAQRVHFLLSLVGQILVVVALLMMAMQRLNRELEARGAALDAALGRAEAGSRAKSLFLASMSHELRTPLNAIIGFAGMIRAGLPGPPDDPRRGEAAADIEDSGRHLLGLIDGLLDLARIEAGRYRLVEAPVDLRRTAIPVARLAAAAAGVPAGRIAVEIAEPGPVVLADERALRQMLLNLLANALRFTDGEGAVRVCARTTPEGLVLEVIDRGVGIPEEAIAALGQPFIQADHGAGGSRGGTGIGLFVTRGLAELHGGTMSISSRIGEGTCVAILLPAARVLEPGGGA